MTSTRKPFVAVSLALALFAGLPVAATAAHAAPAPAPASAPASAPADAPYRAQGTLSGVVGGTLAADLTASGPGRVRQTVVVTRGGAVVLRKVADTRSIRGLKIPGKATGTEIVSVRVDFLDVPFHLTYTVRPVKQSKAALRATDGGSSWGAPQTTGSSWGTPQTTGSSWG